MPPGEIAFCLRRPPPIEAQRLTRSLGRPWRVLKSLSTPGGDNIGFVRSKWVDLMMHRGALACAKMTYSRNNSPSNFTAMCRARVMYEAAVEAIGKDVAAKSMRIEDAALRRAGLRPKLFPRPRPDAA